MLGRHTTRRRIRFAATGLLAGILAALAPHGAFAVDPPPPPPPQMVDVIVQQWNGADSAPAALVAQLGGAVTKPLPVVGGFAARVPLDAIPVLTTNSAIRVVSPDHPVYPQAINTPTGQRKSVYQSSVGATDAAARGFTGAGSNVALIDTGVSDVPALAGRIRPVVDVAGATVPCVNLSAEPTCHDTYGHGTFVAGLVNGTAPDAGIVSVKIAGRNGQSNVSTVLTALGWVIENRGLYDIDIVNLSLRTDSSLSYRFDPLNLAVERAWARGITVVVAAGNQGPTARTIAKPGDDPWVITVGATDDGGSAPIADDTAVTFSSRGPTLADGLAKPDIAAPGRSLISLRSPGSAADTDFPNFVDDQHRRGSGSSFSAPIVAGAAAVFLQAHPEATNDRVKFALMQTARPSATATPDSVGSGTVNANAAIDASAGIANQNVFHPLLFPSGTPTLLDAAGLLLDGVATFDGTNWQGTNWQGTNWQGTNWQGTNWQGTNWQGTNWQGTNWQGTNWQGTNWQGTNWQGTNWQADYWS